jgi:RNA polymerase sigma-70 factor (ECF subfamily)
MHAEEEEEAPDGETQRLARLARGGDAERFSELYGRLAPALHAWATMKIRPSQRGALDPEDVVAEVWVRAFRALPQYDPDTSFRAWLFRIAKNVLLESFRKLRPDAKGPAAGSSTRIFQLGHFPDSATAISRRVARLDGVQHLLEWARTLEEDERQLLVHCGLEGLSYAEASERTGVARDTIAKRWQKLRERARQFSLPLGEPLVD